MDIKMYKNFLNYLLWKKIVVLGIVFIIIFYFIPLIWHAFEMIFPLGLLANMNTRIRSNQEKILYLLKKSKL